VHFVFCIGIILAFAVELFVASYCWPQTSQPSFCHDCAIYLSTPAFCSRCHHCCSLRSRCCHHCPQQSPTTDHHPPPCLLPLSWRGRGVIESRCAEWWDNNDIWQSRLVTLVLLRWWRLRTMIAGSIRSIHLRCCHRDPCCWDAGGSKWWRGVAGNHDKDYFDRRGHWWQTWPWSGWRDIDAVGQGGNKCQWVIIYYLIIKT
jgi:hypothetical protein